MPHEYGSRHPGQQCDTRLIIVGYAVAQKGGRVVAYHASMPQVRGSNPGFPSQGHPFSGSINEYALSILAWDLSIGVVSYRVLKMEVKKEKIRYILQFFFDKSENVIQAAEILNGVNGAYSVTANYVQFRIRRFRSSIFDVKDAPRTGSLIIEKDDKITEILKFAGILVVVASPKS
ncbi:histone-lysine N-methyltransferase SETMAR [Trichonephila clavipes]|nr:histone-lysine N-methyltransferase SETMAR [Trichonephila clavipes]